jgi:two-component system, NarL family, invasion response regulator UvrY
MITINVLIADDHRIVREGLKQVLAEAQDLNVVGEAHNGQDVVAQVSQLIDTPLHVVLLDIAMPQTDGLDALKTLRKSWPNLAILMLSTYPEEHYAVHCIELGASGYINKSADPDDMIAAIRKVASGGVYVSATTAEALARSVANRSTKAGIQALSAREEQVYQLLILGRSVSEIGAQLQLASNTVSTYRARILEKTGTKNDVELALFAQKESLRK